MYNKIYNNYIAYYIFNIYQIFYNLLKCHLELIYSHI